MAPLGGNHGTPGRRGARFGNHCPNKFFLGVWWNPSHFCGWDRSHDLCSNNPISTGSDHLLCMSYGVSHRWQNLWYYPSIHFLMFIPPLHRTSHLKFFETMTCVNTLKKKEMWTSWGTTDESKLKTKQYSIGSRMNLGKLPLRVAYRP